MSKAMSSSQRAIIALGSIVSLISLISYFVWDLLPIHDDPAYFNFADQRFFHGISNYNDVFSNLFFIYLSLFSIYTALQFRYVIEKRIWEPFLLLNVAVFFTGWGSSYFHVLADPKALIWDRMPMAIGFSSLLAMIISERVIFKFHRIILIVLVTLGIWSVWNIDHGLHDLRFYTLVQFGSLLTLAFILMLLRKGHIPRAYLWFGLLSYILAKIAESNDHFIFNFTYENLSGHTLKHLLATLGVFVVNVGVLRSGRQQVGN